MKTLLLKCQELALSYWITENHNWCFKAKDSSITKDDLSEIQELAQKQGLECKLFPASASFNSESGEKEFSDANFIIMSPKTASDEDMLAAF
jgi:hypothetical protein